MSKKLYNIVMQPGVPETDLLENEAVNMELNFNPDLFDGLLCMMLTEDEAEIIVASGKVIECLPERNVIETSYPTSTPRYEGNTQTYRTKFSPSTALNGKDYTSMNTYFTSEFEGQSGFTPPIGYFGDYEFSDTVKTNFAGDYVDIVAIEAGSPATDNAGHEDHVDFEEFDSNNSKFVPMDWSTQNSSVTSARNNQVTNNNTNWFSDHAIGVLSAAGGKYCGWGKKSTLRVIYLTDGTTNAYYAVLQWHISKAVNPATGVRNATVVTGAWGYSGVEHERFYRCDQINSLEVYDKDTGVQSTISRPTGTGWGSDLTSFTNNLFVPRVVQDPITANDNWCISVPDQTRASFFDTIMGQYNASNGIYHFKSAGNNAHVMVNPDDPRWNNKILIDGNANGVLNTLDSEGRNQFTDIVTGSTLSYYCLRSEIDGGDNQFTIAACQQDDTNRLMDDYSSRGPAVDFASYGAYTWTSYPISSYSDGKWAFFSGTSCAAPVAAGCATVFLDHWFTQRGVYPSIAQLKAHMIKHAKSNLIGEDLINFSSVPSAGNISSTKLYSSSEVNRVKDNDYQNGGADLTELYGTPPLRVHIPWGIRLGSGKYIAGGSEQTTNGRRPTSGRAWPRQKVSFSS